MLRTTLKSTLAALCLISAASAFADLTIPMYTTAENGSTKMVGTVVVSKTKYGLLFTPNLENMPAGTHGFHIHENPTCGDGGMAAGSHWDPQHTNKHLGPYNQGHLGDLPVITIMEDGTATLPVLAPRLDNLNKIKNHALMIHEGGDNYSDIPAKLGGGGARMYCGIIK